MIIEGGTYRNRFNIIENLRQPIRDISSDSILRDLTL
jgi:hypothetical protein